MPKTLELQSNSSIFHKSPDFEMIDPTDPSSALISVNPGRLSGTPCFAGTRVPIKHLWDYLEAGEPLEEFLEGFEGVSREQVVGVMEAAYQSLMKGLSTIEDPSRS